MAATIPYAYIQCPCSSDGPLKRHNPADDDEADGEDAPDEARPFDPRAPRANFSLYPMEYLLYCADCYEIRCQRCVLDEIVYWFCPNCLFEVPSSTVKSEGNRCTRSCFQCPICVSPLSTTTFDTPPSSSLLGVESATQSGPFVLSCTYCNWSSIEIGLKFEKTNGIYAQLMKHKNGVDPRTLPNERHKELMASISESTTSAESQKAAPQEEDLDEATRFSKLKKFYQNQIADTSGTGLPSFAGDYGYGSPGALSRIMSIYTGGGLADKKAKSKAAIMREAQNSSEGLQIWKSNETETIEKMKTEGWDGTANLDQRSHQPSRARFISDLRPIATPLRTKRAKRCRTCRHILFKPENKIHNTRWRIRLIASSYIPSMTIRSFNPTTSDPFILEPSKPAQFLLTLKNPLFEPVRVTLATPAETPGRFKSKTTILCPEFEIGANTDVWDEALASGSEKRRTVDLNANSGQAEAGKVWQRGRNWVSVVVEVVPAELTLTPEKDSDGETSDDEEKSNDGKKSDDRENYEEQALGEDEDIVEIPVFVRIEWEDNAAGEDIGRDKEKAKEKREMAYWSVLGVGRIAKAEAELSLPTRAKPEK